MFTRVAILLLTLSALSVDSYAAIQVGTARIDITPTEPIRLNGYGGRREPSSGVAQKLWAKALVIGKDNPSVIITTDLIGVPDWLTRHVRSELAKSYDVQPAQVALCATHTHTGPTVKGILEDIFMAPIPPDHMAAIDRYAEQLKLKVLEAARQALDTRRAGKLHWGVGKADFAINRRNMKDGKWIGFGEVPDGPVDHSLPLMRVTDSKGNIVALLVNYACHCTTLGGNYNQIHGDWAGEAAARIEKKYPNVNAMIAIGCGADANPKARGTYDSIPIHGQAVADEVDRILETKLTAITKQPRGTIGTIKLPFDPLPSKADWQKMADSKSRQSYYGQKMLRQLAAGKKLQKSINYSIQTWQFGDQLAMVFLPGEVVVDYSLRLKEMFDAKRLWINAYANDLPSYIASRRLYDEGGYEVDRSMWYYGKPTRLSKDTEELVLDEVTRQVPHDFYSDKTLRQMPAPVEKEAALKTIRVRKGMTVELAAAEPMVLDPVDIAWGPDGRMWAVEMADYPNGLDDKGQSGGRIRFLTDDDGDGNYDRSTLFADGLNFPTSVQPWRDGVLVTAAPDILFLKDTNGDGKADVTEKRFEGFIEGNQQHRVNGLQWGLDNWIHSANGDSNGKIKSVKTGKVVDISNMDFKFQPDTGEFERLTSRTQYGRNRNDEGDWFGSNNSIPGWHYVLPDHYTRRNPHVSYPSSRTFLQTPGSAGPVYPASRTLNRLNDYSKANRFTSACGLAFYRDTLLGSEFHGNSFICEPVHNLVRREVLRRDGAAFKSRQPVDEKGTEFFASTDNWSRPTSVRTGPDGALYVVDMYRFLIEHPQWVPADWQRKLILRDGSDKGRIYRVYPNGKQLRPIRDLTKLSTEQLVAALNSPNGIERDRVHMLLVWQSDKSAIKHLHTLFWNSEIGDARMHALCVLEALGGLSSSLLADALLDEHPGVRRHAIRLSEPHFDRSLLLRMARLVQDRDLGVRQQLAFSLGKSDSPLASQLLAELANNAGNDPYHIAAILSSVNGRMDTLAQHLGPDTLPSTLFAGLLRTALANKSDVGVNVLALAGLKTRQGQTIDLLRRAGIMSRFNEPLRPVFAKSFATATDNNAKESSRVDAIHLLGRAPRKVAKPNESFWPIIESATASSTLKLAALDALTRHADTDTGPRLLKNWSGFGPAMRSATMRAILNRTAWTEALLKNLTPALARAVPPVAKISLTKHRTASIRKLAAAAFGDQADRDRGKIIARFEPAAKLTGDAKAGHTLFNTACAVCHRVGDTGNAIGPDLTALTDRSAPAMLAAILDPNRAVEDKFLSYTATLKDGSEITGLIAEETSGVIRLADATGRQHSIPRSGLTSLKSSGLSLMPEGFESALNQQTMADLLAYLKSIGTDPAVKADAKGDFHFTMNGRPIAEDERVTWTVGKIPAGTYDIMYMAAVGEAYEGKPFHLIVGGSQVDGTIEYTGALNRHRARKFGNIRIPKTLTNATVEFRHSLSGPNVAIRELVLIPLR